MRARHLATLLALSAVLFWRGLATAQMGQAAPPGHGTDRPLPDKNQPSERLAAGTVEASIVKPDETPLAGIEVRLGQLFQSIAEGERRSSQSRRTNAEGRALFSGLETGGRYSYRVTVSRDGAEYSSAPFNLDEDRGREISLHLYPVTRDPDRALLGSRGFIHIEPRDDVFRFQVLYRVFNVGTITWVPDGVVKRLPHDFSAFTAQESMQDTRFVEVKGRGAELVGTYSPGQHDVAFTFHLPNNHRSTQSFDLGLLPHVAELRVIVRSAPTMQIAASGFDAPQVAQDQQGNRVLVTRRLAERGGRFDDVTIELSGIPTPGSQRWWVVGLAVLVAFSGIFLQRTGANSSTKPSDIDPHHARQARELLLRELVTLERARQDGSLGPRTYDDARRVLLAALSRLGRPPARQRGAPKEQVAAT